MTAPDYGHSFGAWRAAAGDSWQAYSRHAFVEGMKTGTLPRAAFLSYLQQDYVFLIHFARAWSLAVVKADSLEEMKAASSTVHALLHLEMDLHIRSCAAAGISPAALEATIEAPENLAYTRYVLEAGYSGDFLDLLAALAPCVLGYGEIGARLRRECGETPYRDWIDTYGGADYQQLCHATGALIDSAVASRLGRDAQNLPRWKSLERRFITATTLEAAFWGLGRA